ncbi:hypothetical protein SUGI_1125650 [Cryptomeria japonica]|uniref:uncharacterized protein LOC131037594 n=1 Tax=Cryptomeria japonica TaxID=3369 RepID=UPI002414B5C0|nr:uncharacterized protein LOC131037594 [Cryptomeria japonica]GLJ52838.1 hypothetical protein SUGI_1125650 [Cryptomeria japonica]
MEKKVENSEKLHEKLGWDYLHYECRKVQSTEQKNVISIRPPTVQRILKELEEEDWYHDFFKEYSFIESQRYFASPSLQFQNPFTIDFNDYNYIDVSEEEFVETEEETSELEEDFSKSEEKFFEGMASSVNINVSGFSKDREILELKLPTDEEFFQAMTSQYGIMPIELKIRNTC